MKYIFLHGRAQGGKAPLALKALWLEALNDGLNRAGKSPVPDSDVFFPFYGDLLGQLVESPVESLGVKRRGREASPDDVLEAQYEMAAEMAVQAGISQADIRKHYRGEVIERGPENWEWVQAILRTLDEKTEFGTWLVNKITRDTAFYLQREGIRTRIHELILSQIPRHEPLVWVTHSMGTIISYWIFLENPTLEVPRWYTIGSPLGVKAVRSRLPMRVWPEPVEQLRWVNIFDERDVVALYPIGENSGWDFPVNNQLVVNETVEPHDICGYLKHPTIAESL